jgi:hypothetical protein
MLFPVFQVTRSLAVFQGRLLDIQGDQKVSVHLMIIVQKHEQYFKQFQSLNMITLLELGIIDGVSVSLVSPWPWRSTTKQNEPSSQARKTCVVIIRCTENFWSPCPGNLTFLYRCGMCKTHRASNYLWGTRLIINFLVGQDPHCTVRSESRCKFRLRYVRSKTSLPTPFISAQWLSERRPAENVCE